ncbi:hypothetical protein [Flavobacterium sp. CAU 1735]|uniref:hypothetical protein n=1 Tax=Flavobacterium sp. CAU 1735 TaxID=3140361 RepID=UPI003261A112
MKLNKNTATLYVIAPANFASGGPFLMHQLASKLLNMGFKAKMVYIGQQASTDPVHDFYKRFKIPYTNTITDASENIVIFPEIYTGMIYHYKKIHKVIWWLSVDFFLAAIRPKPFSLRRFLGLKPTVCHYDFKKEPLLSHWVQSHYARHFLESKNVTDIYNLSDYLDAIFIDKLKRKSFTNQNKSNRIVYNPKKGYNETLELIRKAPLLDWVPIANMTPSQVRQLLLSAKIYIDFGNHPGKDRIPREAAMCGCIIVTNKKGSANFAEDIPIPDKFKIDYIPGKERDIIDLLEHCFTAYENEVQHFDTYRKKIEQEEAVFNDDLAKIITTFFD